MKKAISLGLIFVLFFSIPVYGYPSPSTGQFKFINVRENRELFTLIIDKKTKRIKVINIVNQRIINSTTNNTALKMDFYDGRNNLLYSLVLNSQDTPYSLNIAKLEAINFSRGSYIKLEIFSDAIGFSDTRHMTNGTLKQIIQKKNSLPFEEIRYYFYNDIFRLYMEEPPTLEGVDDATIEQGSSFDDMKGVTAESEVDGDITDDIKIYGAVDTNTIGEYFLTYSIIDSTKKTAQKTRKITVIPSKKPPKKPAPAKLYKRTVVPYKYKSNSFFKEHKERDNYFLVK